MITSYVVAGRSVYINSVTAERSKWIDKLRSNLAAYSGGLAALTFRKTALKFTDDIEERLGYREELEKLNHIASVIQLQLNPWGDIDRNILAIMNAMAFRLSTPVRLIDRADKLFIAHAQWLLKAEWERVKFEARSPVYRATRFWSAPLRRRAYRKWAEGEGSIETLLDEFKAFQFSEAEEAHAEQAVLKERAAREAAAL